MTPLTPLDDTEDSDFPPVDRARAASRSTRVSVVVNVVLSTAQIVTGLLAQSQGLIADGLHSLSGLVGDFVVLLAGRHASKAADAEHPYGHQRFETAASLALGGLLLAVGIGIVGNLMGYPLLDPIAALIVGFMVGRMGWTFAWDALHHLMDRSADDQEVAAIWPTGPTRTICHSQHGRPN